MKKDKVVKINTSDDFMRKKDASEFLKVSIASIDRMINRRSIPFYKMGRVILFRKSDLVTFLEGYRTESA
jgi:excisionase family DNA binding protein